MIADLLSTLDGCIPDRPVWTADISYWISGRRQDGTADAAWHVERGYLELHRDLGIMPYYYYDKFWTAEPVYDGGVVLHTWKDGGLTQRRFETPVGSLTEESVYLPASACEGIRQHMVQNEADLDVLIYILEHRTLIPSHLDDYAERRELWNDYGGIPCLGLPRSPLPALTYEWCGLQAMVMLMLDCRDKVERVLHLLEGQEKPVLDAVCELKPPLVHFPDNLSSDNFTGLYDEHMRRRHCDRLQLLHGAGIKAAVHLDGTIGGLLPKLVGVGFDAVEALTPHPAGDLTVEEIRGIVDGSDVIMWGGVPGVMFAPPYSWYDLQRHVRHTLDVWSGSRCVLGVSDQVPPDGDIDYCRKIGELIREY